MPTQKGLKFHYKIVAIFSQKSFLKDISKDIGNRFRQFCQLEILPIFSEIEADFRFQKNVAFLSEKIGNCFRKFCILDMVVLHSLVNFKSGSPGRRDWPSLHSLPISTIIFRLLIEV